MLKAPRTVRYYLRHAPFVLRMAALATLVVALARPQSTEQNTRTNTDGIDIMLALDVSGSMLARDFRPDRLEAAKEVAGSFISDRYGDRIGLVAFAGEAFTQSPLTTDQGRTARPSATDWRRPSTACARAMPNRRSSSC